MSNRALSKKLASVKPGTAFVGADLALDRNVAVVLTERAEQVSRFGFPNERDGYDYFYRRLDTIREQRQAPAVGPFLRSPCRLQRYAVADSGLSRRCLRGGHCLRQ
jgi:hypothetical protein